MNNFLVKETVVSNITGYLLQDDLDQWEDKIFELLENKQKRIKMGISARNRAIEEFSWDAFMRKIEENLEQMQIN